MTVWKQKHCEDATSMFLLQMVDFTLPAIVYSLEGNFQNEATFFADLFEF